MTVYNKLYVVVRTDLPPEAQAIQAAHAATEWAMRYGSDFQHPTFVFLQVENKFKLWMLAVALVLANRPYVPFYEPDFDRGLTAIAVHHGGYSSDFRRHSILKNLSLWQLKK